MLFSSLRWWGLALLCAVPPLPAQLADVEAVPRGAFMVNLASDEPDAAPGDGACRVDFDPTQLRCSLRAAIDESNALRVPTRIQFDVPASGELARIQPRTALPELQVPIIIDGTSQPNTRRIDLDGRRLRNQGIRGSALVLRNHQGSRIRGLSIHGFTDHGIEIRGGGQHVVSHNELGLAADGALDPNAGAGVFINGSTGNTVGGFDGTAEGNVFAGSRQVASSLSHPAPGVLLGPLSSRNSVLGNRFGLDRSARALGLAGPGVFIANSTENLIGSSVTPTAGNVIAHVEGSDLFGYGILLSGANATGNVLIGNLIGTDPGATERRGNGAGGIRLFAGASNNVIGGSGDFAANVVVASPVGMLIGAEPGDPELPCTGNIVAGNFIGTNVAGSRTLGNVRGLVLAGVAQGNQIGSVNLDGNVISGNVLDNLVIEGRNATGNSVIRNRIGTDLFGSTAVLAPGSTASGVRLGNGASGNSIGSSDNTQGNIIAGNGGDGVLLAFTPGLLGGAPVDGNRINGNLIGVALGAQVALPNGGHGVRVLDAPNTSIGSTSTSSRNVIAGNRLSGILIAGAGAGGSSVSANLIGSDLSGQIALPNGAPGLPDCAGGHGVHVIGAAGIQVGSSAVAQRNQIRFNAGAGVRIEDRNTCIGGLPAPAALTLVTVRGNLVQANAALGIDVGQAGPDGNDQGDADQGANTLLNAPLLQTALPTGTLLSYVGAPTVPLIFDIYASSACDPSGFGEGEQPVATMAATTNNIGQAFLNLPRFAIGGKPNITAVATASNAPGSRSSEFSNCVSEGNSAPGPAFQASSLQMFQFVPGGPLPAAQNLGVTAINTTVPQSYSITRNVPWISVTPASGLTPSTVSVRVDPAGLPAGLNSGTLTVQGSATTTTVTVQLQIGTPMSGGFAASPAGLVFQGVVGGANPPTQVLAIIAGAQVQFSATDNAPWLSLSPASGLTPSNTSVAVNLAGLAAGTYQAIISVSGGGLPALQIPVNLQVAPASGGGSLLANPGFESGTAPWTFTGESIRAQRDGLAQEGVAYALLAPLAESSRVHQTLAVPCSGAAGLRFQLNVSSTLTVPTAADRLFVEITTPAGALRQIVASYSNLDRTAPGLYTLRGPFDLSAFACENVRLQFRAEPNSSFGTGATSFRVDAVSVN